MRSSFQFCWISVFPWIKPPEILALCKTSLNDSTESGDSSVRGHLPLIRKDSSYMHGLAACVNKEHLLHGIISRKPCGFLLMFFISFTSFSVFLLFFLSVTVFDSNSSNTDEVFSINPSANVLFFGNFGIHHKDWLTFFDGTDRSSEPCYNFSISNDLSQMVNFSTGIPDCDSHNSPAVLHLFISSDASICFTMVFPPLRNSDHVFVSISIDFPMNSKQDALFQCIGYSYSLTDWDDLHDHLRDVPWEDIFKLNASAAASEFCEWAQVRNDLYIIVHRNHFLSFVPTE